MDFSSQLKAGLFRRRFKRFFAEIEVDGKIITAHVPNTGSLKGCLSEGARCLYSTSDDPERKLAHSLMALEVDGTWVGVNTHLANDIVAEAIRGGALPKLKKWDSFQREVKIHAQTRLDFALWRASKTLPHQAKVSLHHFKSEKFHFIEVKNVTWAENSMALFPDSVTERGQKHLEELMALHEQGHSAEILFLVQRKDCRQFRPADEVDPVYGKLLRQALKAGVKISAYPCAFDEKRVELIPKPLALEL